MSALGHERRFRTAIGMSALPRKQTFLARFASLLKCQKQTVLEFMIHSREQRYDSQNRKRWVGMDGDPR